jgi:hypothetical protein
MASRLDELRIGETVRVRATIVDHLGNPATVASPAFGVVGSTGVFDLATDTGGPTYTRLTGAAPGVASVQFSGSDAFSNAVEQERAVTVLDASRLRLTPYNPVNCTLVSLGGGGAATSTMSRYFIRPTLGSTGDPTISIEVRGQDSRGGTPGGDSYDLNDIVISTLNGKIVFASETSTGYQFTGGVITARGSDVLTATSTTVATSTPVTGSIRIEIVTANSASLSTQAF